jgi:hypothetical protein
MTYISSLNDLVPLLKLDINLNSDIHHAFLFFYLEDHLLLLYILTVANLHARMDGLTSYRRQEIERHKPHLEPRMNSCPPEG